MSNTTARVRISRIRMKGGGADVHVIPRRRMSDVSQHMRQWVESVDGARSPDAYMAVAFWFNADSPVSPDYSVGFLTRPDAMPAPVLRRLAAAYCADEAATARGARRAVEDMGVEPAGWEPEPTG